MSQPPPQPPPPGSPPPGDPPPSQPPGWGQPPGQPPAGGPQPGWVSSPDGGPPTGGSGRSNGPLIAVLAVLVVALVVAGAVLVLGGDEEDGGGGDGGGGVGLEELSAEEQEYAEAIAESMTANVDFDSELAQCVGSATVQVVGLEDLQATTPDEIRESSPTSLREVDVAGIDESQAQDLGDLYADCGDFMTAALQVYGDVGLPDDAIECFEENVTEEEFAHLTAAGYAGSEEIADAAELDLGPALASCRGA
jgi:hypothetical protein